VNKVKKLLLLFVVLGLSVASAKTYQVKLFQDASLNGSDLKAGEYRMEFEDGKVVLRDGRKSVEAPARLETNGQKFGSTSVRMRNEDGKLKITEIRIGGTNTKVVVN
jgi:hypothetical protein